MKHFIYIIMIFLFTATSSAALEYQGRLIKPGLQGEDVKAVQQCLLDMGFLLPVYGADGWYGAETYLQITEYQRSEGLQYVDGIVGPETAQALSCEPRDEYKVEVASRVITLEGEQNDSAEFVMSFDLPVQSSVSYVSEDAGTAIDFSIIDTSAQSVVYTRDGEDNMGAITTTFWSSALAEETFYRIDEGKSERFEFRVLFDPYAGTPSGFGAYQLQIQGVTYHLATPDTDPLVFDTSSLPSFTSDTAMIIE